MEGNTLEPSWMTTARHMIGQRETPGPQTAPFMSTMLRSLGAWWQDDETPWCGAFVASCLHDNGLDIPAAWYRARAYEKYGREYPDGDVPFSRWPAYGCITVLNRPPKDSNGHVAFFVSMDGRENTGGPLARVLLLGGNQDNQVCVRSYPLARVVAFRWPADAIRQPTTFDARAVVASLAMGVPASRSEA